MYGQNDQRGMIQEMRHSFQVVWAVCSYLCVPLAVVMSRAGTIGERYAGFPALVGFAMQFVIVALTGGRTAAEQVLVACGLPASRHAELRDLLYDLALGAITAHRDAKANWYEVPEPSVN
jgi:hypothetical protein